MFALTVLLVCVQPDDSVLAVGMVDGLLSIQHRNKASKVAETKRKKVSFHYRLKGKTFNAQKEDLVVTNKRREKMAPYDKLLKRFEHTKALDAAMEPHVRQQTPEVTMGVLQELIRRGVLRPALAGRDTRQLQGILRFIQKHLCKPHFTSTLLDVMGELLDLYEGEIAGNAVLEAQVAQVKVTVDREVAYLRTCCR
ncbi:hypothetical protein BaRGS_00019510 [Batillaria attramentaria]|uniref:U3 small nucleolar RNA-associated protein 15 C-terminal domain-containing protein n=1 Tax=Batillaria attramentaria TaxID=370345 RepID=A0ABD0KQU3_9CAEN